LYSALHRFFLRPLSLEQLKETQKKKHPPPARLSKSHFRAKEGLGIDQSSPTQGKKTSPNPNPQ
jgi:hypothetical protein